MKSTILFLILFMSLSAFAQEHSEKITRELAFEKKGPANALIIANINGNIKVEGYDGDKILIEVNKRITAKTDARLQKGKSEVQLGVIDRADTLIVYAQNPCNTFGRQDRSDNRGPRGWDYNWNNNCQNCNTEYDYRMDFTVKVPRAVNLMARTINDGDVEITNVSGGVSAHNINGSIKLVNISKETDATTINGDVDIEYAQNPAKDCHYYSLNGDINAWFKKGLAANMSFESFNGNFYTNVESLEALPTEVSKENTNKGIRYKVNGNRFKIGKGGATFLDFETFNGNVYLKEK